jgi:hypothetical protein
VAGALGLTPAALALAPGAFGPPGVLAFGVVALEFAEVPLEPGETPLQPLHRAASATNAIATSRRQNVMRPSTYPSVPHQDPGA